MASLTTSPPGEIKRPTPLGKLMPELAEIETSVMEDGLSTRAVNVLVRAGVTSFAQLRARLNERHKRRLAAWIDAGDSGDSLEGEDVRRMTREERGHPTRTGAPTQRP